MDKIKEFQKDILNKYRKFKIKKKLSFNEYCFKHEEFLPYMSLLSKNDFKKKYDKNLNYIKKVEELFFDKKSKYIYNSLFKWFYNVQ